MVGEGRREGVRSSPVVAEAVGAVGVLGVDVADEQVPYGARVGDGDGTEPRIEGRAVAMVDGRLLRELEDDDDEPDGGGVES